MSDRSPESTLANAIAGDTDALSLLWREHRRWVAAVLLAHLPGGVDLEDLLQDVAVNYVANLRRLRDPSAFRPWLRAIAVNAARSAGRRRAVQKRVHAPLPPAVDEGFTDPAGVREALLESARERLDRVLAILRNMHADYREPMWLRAVDGMSQQQVAATLGLPVTTVETRLARGRRMLRAALQSAVEAPLSPGRTH